MRVTSRQGQFAHAPAVAKITLRMRGEWMWERGCGQAVLYYFKWTEVKGVKGGGGSGEECVCDGGGG